MVELSCADAGDPVLQEAYRSDHALCQPVGEDRREGRAGNEQRPRAPESGVDRPERLGGGLLDDDAPIDAGDLRHRRQHRLSRRVPAGNRLAGSSENGSPQHSERLRCGFVGAQHQADVWMSDEAPRLVEHKSLSGSPHPYRRDHVPDELEVDLRNRHPDRRAVARNCDGHEGFRATIKRDRTKPDPLRAGSLHGQHPRSGRHRPRSCSDRCATRTFVLCRRHQ